jgi:hypothetical protein
MATEAKRAKIAGAEREQALTAAQSKGMEVVSFCMLSEHNAGTSSRDGIFTQDGHWLKVVMPFTRSISSRTLTKPGAS